MTGIFLKIVNTFNIKKAYRIVFSESLLKNAVYLIIGSLVTSLISFVFLIVATRLYTAQAVGLSSAAISYVGLISLISEFGLGIALIRFLPSSEKEQNNVLNFFLTINCVASTIITIIFVWGLNVWSQSLLPISQSPLLLVTFIIFAITSAMQPLLLNVFLAKRKSEYITLINSIVGILKIIFIVVLAHISNNVFGILIGVGLATIIGVVLLIFLIIPRVQTGFSPIPRFSNLNRRKLLTYSIGNYVARLLLQMPPLLIPLIIVDFLGAEINAVFYVAWSIASLLQIIPSSICNSLFAEASNDANSLRTNTIKSIRFMFCLIIPATLIITIIAGKLLSIFGASYPIEGTLLLQVIAASTIPWGINYLYVSIARYEKRTRDTIKVTGISTIISLSLSYILMLRIGLVGVGIGYITGQSITAIVVIWLLMNTIFRRAPKI